MREVRLFRHRELVWQMTWCHVPPMPEWTLWHYWGLTYWSVNWVFTCWYGEIWTIVWGWLPGIWVTMVSPMGTYSLLMWGNKPSVLHIRPLMPVFMSGWLIQPWSPAAFILSPADGRNRRPYLFRSRQQGLTKWGWYWMGKPGIVSQGKELILIVTQEWSDTSDSRLHSGIYGTSCMSYSGGHCADCCRKGIQETYFLTLPVNGCILHNGSLVIQVLETHLQYTRIPATGWHAGKFAKAQPSPNVNALSLTKSLAVKLMKDKLCSYCNISSEPSNFANTCQNIFFR